jgi:hypothetical protein
VFKEGEKPSLLSSCESSDCSPPFGFERLISCCHRSSCFAAA